MSQVDNVSLPLTYASSNYKQTLLAVPSGGDQRSGRARPSPRRRTTVASRRRAPGPTRRRCASWTSPPGTRRRHPLRQRGPGDHRRHHQHAVHHELLSSTTTGGRSWRLPFRPTRTRRRVRPSSATTASTPGSPGTPLLYQSNEGTDLDRHDHQHPGAGHRWCSGHQLEPRDRRRRIDRRRRVDELDGRLERRIVDPGGQQVFTLVDNSATSAIGNACANPTAGSGLTVGNGLSGVGTNSVECQASVSSDKTGTVMISAPAPSSLTDLHGRNRARGHVHGDPPRRHERSPLPTEPDAEDAAHPRRPAPARSMGAATSPATRRPATPSSRS